MPWKYLETKVQFPNPEEPVQIGEIRYGKIIFIPQEDLFVDSIGYYIFRINTTPPQEETIFEEGGKTLLNRTTLERGKEYEFEFPFEGKYPVTYSGKNIGVHWEVKTFVHLRTEEYLTIRKDYIERHKLTYGTDTSNIFDKRFPIRVKDNSYPFISHEKEKDMGEDFSYTAHFFLGAAAIALAIIYFSDLANSFRVSTVAIIAIVILFIVYYSLFTIH